MYNYIYFVFIIYLEMQANADIDINTQEIFSAPVKAKKYELQYFVDLDLLIQKENCEIELIKNKPNQTLTLEIKSKI
jgi:hypothetical protein